MATKKKTPTQTKADEKARERREALKQAIADGSVTVRKMTAAERKAMEAHRAAHGKPARPTRRRRSHS